MNDRLSKLKTNLDKVGCGFCLAKWTQVTLHLSTGMTHSCHHPEPHKIPLTEIKRNPSALHNTSFNKKKRKEMLEGKRPEECNFCWNIEDNSNSFSDRVFKSSEPWSLDQFENIKNSFWRTDYNPRYVEVSFSNTCNFKCAYCGPQFSSKWIEELEKFGPYPTSGKFNGMSEFIKKGTLPYKQSEDNPYVEAFWKWWPDLYKDLHTFRITGGEPLLSKDTWKVLEYIQNNPNVNRNLSLSINTNLGVPDVLVDRFIDIANDLCTNNKVRELTIFTSIEATGKQAEYLRTGLNEEVFWSNVEKVLNRLPKVTVTVMATYNALSVFTYSEVIEKVMVLKTKYANTQRYWISAIQLDTSYLRYPSHLSVKILSRKDKELIRKSAEKMLYYGIRKFTPGEIGFSNTEIQKIKRVYDYASSHDTFNIKQNRKDFKIHMMEKDKRNGTNFKEVFPELERFIDRITI